MTGAAYGSARKEYRRSLQEFALALRLDIDEIVQAVERGEEISADRVRECRRALSVLGRALATYDRTRRADERGPADGPEQTSERARGRS
jgi:hypothetical protein